MVSHFLFLTPNQRIQPEYYTNLIMDIFEENYPHIKIKFVLK